MMNIQLTSSGGGFYHLLKKRDGSFWLLDASEGHQTSVVLSRVELPPGVVAYEVRPLTRCCVAVVVGFLAYRLGSRKSLRL